ncbi:dnaJ homolog subfamily C member 24 [Xiphophorus couchianus]|uniref:dnaJ homolog subfamily C member 24 n=1 Tax=Xiphophorus couchianus TaxID=32473 RepID=UPI001015D5A8|nr:dnaJ homolog subfamily C member 24 [Xiphophorus couchianus]XP_027855690.1 dnaJ homolog subfamily C member 24 [Xiphophorus couchianus]XP_032404954.1 dnaJ homolog subfamily C member 24 [Xiphophorus hellerii]
MCDPEQKDLYAVLGGSPSDSLQQLRHRYQQLALKYHPDRLGGENSAESSVKTFLEVDAAWKILGDQTTRREYDLQRRAQELKQDWTVDSTVDLEDMTWETDGCECSYSCRCGGTFSVSKEEVQEETQRRLQELNEQEMHRGAQSGVLVCCDTCSLTIYVTWSLNKKMHMSK